MSLRRDAGAMVKAGQTAVLALLTVVYLWCALVVRGPHAFTGDEPHYLAITQSLWLYHTLDQHRVLYHHDFFAYYPYLMSSHSLHHGPHLYPLHYLGLPLVLLPGFALAGARGAQVTTVLIALLTCWRMLRLATRVVGPLPATLALGVLGLSAPFVLNAGAIYPDLFSGLLLVLAYEALDAPRLTACRALALGVVLAAMPWAHIKLLAPVCVYMAWTVAVLWRQSRAPRHRASALTVLPGVLALGLPLLSIASLIAFNNAVYGSPSPTAQFTLRDQALFTGNPLEGMMGQFFSQGQGALGTAPFVLLVFPGAVALWRWQRATALKIGMVTIPFWVATLTYHDWWGGDSPPLRYLLCLLPLWVVGIAALLARMRTLMARLVVGALAAVTLALTTVIPLASRIGCPLPNGHGALLVAFGERPRLPLTAWLPVFVTTRTDTGYWQSAAPLAAWVSALVATWCILAWKERVARRSRSWEGVGRRPAQHGGEGGRTSRGPHADCPSQASGRT